MIRIKKEMDLTFDDVILEPRKSSINSRFNGEMDLSVEILPNVKIKYPIISANMDTITEAEMANTINRLGGLGIIHRFLPIDVQVSQIEKIVGHKILCLGVLEDERLDLLKEDHKFDGVLIDIAHGHSNVMINQIERIRKISADIPIIAGNVATAQGAQELVEAGANCIKVGVGPGCFAAGTRILMSNGTYKNIEEIQIGDSIISGLGKPTVVVGTQCTGIKEVIKVRHTQNANGTVCTPDHRFWCGDLNTISESTLTSAGYARHLDKLAKVTPKQSKYKWKQIKDFQQDVALLPNRIEFELPADFDKKISYRNNEHIRLTPDYELGYLFGFFLGDGNTSCTINKKNGNKSGHITFYPSLEEKHIVEKLDNICWNMFGKHLLRKEAKGCYNLVLYLKPLADLLDTFGKKQHKHLPPEFLVDNLQYLRGLWEGLQDSDGIDSDRVGFKNTSKQLTELYFFLTFYLTGKYPTLEFQPATAGGLDCNINNCNDSILSRICPSYLKRQTKDFQVVKILEITELKMQLPVYDIEVECDSHSFIADNAIVHNSLCTTRLKTGCGVPQLSAIVEVEQAIRGCATVIADGGIRQSGDIVKALAAGADAVMIGRLFSATDEAPGKIVDIPNQGKFKVYRGMASRAAQEDWKGKSTSIEGETTLVSYRGSVEPIFNDLINGVKSGMSYQDAHNITELRENAIFHKQSSSGVLEAKPHALFKK